MTLGTPFRISTLKQSVGLQIVVGGGRGGGVGEQSNGVKGPPRSWAPMAHPKWTTKRLSYNKTKVIRQKID